MSRAYLAIDINAAKLLVQTRDYQSVEYKKGEELAAALKNRGELDHENFWSIESDNGGVVLRTSSFDKSKTLIFDLEEFSGFNEFAAKETLVLFQKSCRLAIKIWEGMPLSSSMERPLDSRYVILLPFSFRTGYYKVALDKNPDQRRQEKRNSHHLMIFRSGNQQFELACSSSNFRKAVDFYKRMSSEEIPASKKGDCGRVIEGFRLDKKPDNELGGFVGFSGVEGHLTDAQKNFIYSTTLGPSVLEGAAGTGKTLSIILRCLNILARAEGSGEEKKVLFITHSSETKQNIEEILRSNGGGRYLDDDQGWGVVKQLVIVSTLQEWCIELLGDKISETEYLDKDARDSKETQFLYILEIMEGFIEKELKPFSRLISSDLLDFFRETEIWALSEMIQSEISVYIKGRANEEIDRYKKLDRSEFSIPLRTEEDFDCLYSIYNQYSSRLISLGQFDSDDIVLTAIGELETPIWRRRRVKEGFDSILIDETHLFNINELCVFHYLTKPSCSNNIVFTIDRSQALGDAVLTRSEVSEALNLQGQAGGDFSGLQTIFRSSPDIIALASHVLSSGASLFTNLENPLEEVSDAFTMEDEKKSIRPYCIGVRSESDLLNMAFREVDEISKRIGSSRFKVAIIPTTDALSKRIEEFSAAANKPHEIIKNRGDIKKIKDAEKGGKYIISGMDYVGGLEFDGVVIVGADKGRLPPTEQKGNSESKHYLTYASFNRLYVAITRAKYAVSVIYSSSRGISVLLEGAVESAMIDSK